jgi:fructuronate reductase
VTRLTEATLARVRDAELPRYDRSVPPTTVHVGVGAFARAHLAVYADDLLASGVGATVRGISLRSPRAESALAAQDGLFTVTTREPGTAPATRVIGSLTSIATGPQHLVGALTDPTTSLVTLTVTEKGYLLDGSGSVPSVLASGLERRRARTDAPLVVVSLDNLIDNGRVLAEAVRVAAARIGGGLDGWISETVRFPRSVVDRMVPATTEDDRDEVARRIGVADEGAVVAEDHRSWVIEAVDGLPPLHHVGVEVVADVDPFQQRKLWLLNGPHSALAYGGLLAGHSTIAAAVADPAVEGLVRRLVDDVLEVVEVDRDSAATFARASLRRFANPALGHRCTQVGADGSTKLPQRILPVMARRRSRGLSSPHHALVVACWLAAVTRTPVATQTLPAVDDPHVDAHRSTLHDHGVRALVAAAVGEDHRDVADEVEAAFDELIRRGRDVLGGSS